MEQGETEAIQAIGGCLVEPRRRGKEMRQTVTPNRNVIAVSTVVARVSILGSVLAGVFLFIYNSGYGHDARETLLLGRHLASEHRFYELFPSRACGLYFMVGTLVWLGMPVSHVTVTVVTTAILLSAVLSGFFFVRRFVGREVAPVAAGLFLVAGLFMELNYLVAEGLVVAAGFASAYSLGLWLERRRLGWALLAGVVIGLGCQFKQTAAFYGVGSVVWMLCSGRATARAVPAYVVGAMVPTVSVAGYFAATGRWEAYLHWTYIVPVYGLPASTEFLDRHYTKLAWFWIALAVAVIAVLTRRGLRREILENPHMRHMLIAGTIALFPMLKNQTPHYVYPGAAFLSVFIAAVFARRPAPLGLKPLQRLLALGAGLLVLCGSALAYRPQAVSRLVQIADFSREDELGARIQELVPPRGKVLFVTSDALTKYLVSERQPAFPLVHFDFQTSYYLANHPDALANALDDPDLVLVEFDPANPPVLRFDPEPKVARQSHWVNFESKLRSKFINSLDPILGVHVWKRKASGESA